MPPSTALVPVPPGQISAETFTPLLSVDQALKRKEVLNEIIARVLLPDIDYGEQPGSASKQRVLKKSGAEKLISTFGFSFRIVEEVKVEDWTGESHGGEPFFFYQYRIALYKGDFFLGEATGSCNSWEKKYRYAWVSEDEVKHREDFLKLAKRGGKRTIFEPDFALNKKETTGKYGKPIEYWQKFEDAQATKSALRTKKKLGKKEFDGWQIEVDETQVRIPNPNAADTVNTVQKMGFKRGLVAAVVVVTNCSDAFTQDLEDEDDDRPARASESQADLFEAGDPGPAGPSEGHAGERGTQDPPSPPSSGQQPPMTAPPTPRRIPEEMKLIIQRVREDPKKHLHDSYALMGRLAGDRGEASIRAHEQLNQEFRNRLAGGMAKSGTEDHVSHLLDQYELLQKFPPAEKW